MDTILYFYPVKMENNKKEAGSRKEAGKEETGSCKEPEKRGMQESDSGLSVSEHQFPVYRLIKIGLTPDQIVLLEEDFQGWLDWKKENGKNKKQPQSGAEQKRKQKGFRFLAGFGKGRQKRKWEAEKKNLLDSVFQLWGEPCSSYCVCRRPITYFNKWEFTDYRESKWVEYLLRYGTLAHFVVLGNAFCLREILPRYARKMKSLRFFMREREVTEELEVLLEDLLSEYGIVADICCLDEDIAYRKLPSLSAIPCNILDFSGEEKISRWAAVPGSIWIDFDGNEEKQRRIESRGKSVHYISLRKEWGRA